MLLGATVVVGSLVTAPLAAQAQFAEGGEGRHRASIDWFSFGEEAQPIADGTPYTNERQIGDDKIVSTCSITDVEGQISTYRSGDFSGDALPYLYYAGGPGTANTMVTGITNTVARTAPTFTISCTADYVTADGSSFEIPLQGLVVADAESSNTQGDEYLQADPRPVGTDVTWRIIDRMKSPECAPEDTTLATPTAEGGLRFAPNRFECVAWGSGYGPMAIAFMEGATSAHITVKGGAHSAVALGMVMSTDFGDAPKSYGAAGAVFQPQWEGGVIDPAGGPKDVFASDFELGYPGESPLTLGKHIDAETHHLYSWDALLDDESGRNASSTSAGEDWSGSDEDALPLIDLPKTEKGTLFNDGAPLSVECRGDGYVAGWLDWNLDGTFDPTGERSEIAKCEGNAAVLTWPSLAELDLPAGVDPTVYLRLRIASTSDDLEPTGVLVPTGVGSAGEVEDYALGVPLIEAAKESTPLSGTPVLVDDEITYTLTFQNVGNVPGEIVYDDFLAGVLDKADFVPDSIVVESPNGSTADIKAEEPTGDPARIDIAGTLEPGQIVNISYKVKVTSKTAGDLLENYLLHVDDAGEPPEKFDECVESNPRCTSHTVLAPDLQVRKSSLPADGQTVKPGQLVTYHLDFENRGDADAENVNFTDDLSEVLKYADVLPDSIRVIGAAVPGSPPPPAPEQYSLEANFDKDAQSLNVTGKLYAEHSGRVEYVVRVHDPITPPEGGGTPALTNFLHPDGTEPPATCEPGDELCTTHPVDLPKLVVSKKANPASGESVVAGQDLTYTLTFDNSAGTAPATVKYTDDLTDVLDDAVVKTDPTASAAGLTPELDGNTLAINGTVPAGQTTTVSYVVTVNPDGERGNEQLGNFLFETGVDPPTTCEPGDDTCTTHPVDEPDLTVSKSAAPATGEAVVAGDTVTYTLTFDNTDGTAPAAVNHVDDLADVLDDADVVTEPTASASDLVAARTGASLSVTGAVPAGKVITVTYSVQVKADEARGNEQLANFLFPEGTEPPTTCEPGDDSCTTHPVQKPELKVSKSADPAAGESVVAGNEVTYTLTFDNTAGTAPATVNHVDNLSDVLDDAELVDGPTVVPASALTGTINEATGEFPIAGTLAAGATATVTYTVKVKADGDRGNEQLANFLFEEGAEPPTTCEPGDETCTTHPVQKPELKVSKSADPATGEAVVAGDEVTYTLTFDNTAGTAASAIGHVDNLSDVLDDAELVDGPTVDPAGSLTGTINEETGEFPITGTLAAGAKATVSYTVKVKADGDRGNEQLANFLFEEGAEPPTTCEPGDDSCTTHPVQKPELKVSKGAASESGNDFVTAGEKLTYTLTFDNSAGTAPAAVQHVDHLAGVLDDADLTDGPTSSDPDALAAALSDDGTQIGVTGAVPAGAVVTVTYVVTVKADGERGDNSLANFLAEEGVDPPTTCEPGDETCTVTPAPELTYTKAAVSESGNDFVTAGEKLTYTLTFDNSKGTAPAALNHVDDLSKVLDDADVTDGPTSSDPANVTAALDGGAERISVTGSVPAGQVVTVTYVVTVKADGERGDNTLANFLLEEGAEPPVTCLPGDETCTETHVPELVLSKSSDPASGEPVIADQEITYTLTFDNSVGKAPAAVNHVDDLSDVLDDAELVDGPTVVPAGALAGEVTDGVFVITGELAAGATATVSYTVQVKADGDRGNEQLANFLFEEGAEPPTTCEPGDDTCTTHPAQSADVSVKKSVDPASGTEVVAGQAVTYTLTFENSGEAPGNVDYTDDLSDVLDDAGITVEPTSSDASLTPNRTGDELRVTGRLAAGATVTVTYEVTVNADGERGNDHLGNVVVETGEEPVCDPEAENCTENPVVFPVIDAQKGSDPESGTVLHAGDDVTYTLTFTNSGTGAGELAFRDRLEEVLDTADIVSGPTVAQGEGSSATAVVNGEGIDIAGTIAPGGTVTVSYTARLHSEVAHGARLTNYLLAPGESVPGLCLPENPRCTDHPAVAPELDVDKSSDPASGEAVEAGQVVTYTLWFHNWSPAEKRVDYVDTLTDVLDDATFVEGSLTVDSTALKAVRSGDKIRITGTLGSDTEATVTYQVTVKPDAERVPEGEAPAGTTPNQLGNVVVESGQEPPAVCEPGDWHCTVNPMPNVIAKKSADPASGETVMEGQELTYTLHFENVGTAAGQVAFRDTLRDVLDDADFVDGSLVASEGLEASGPTANEILVTGSLEAGATGTVEYSVTVKPDTERESDGNNQLANFVFGEGTEPPTTCEPGDDSCTTHPAPDLVVSKGVDPESGTTVAAGQELTYTLTFSNAGNAAGEVAYEDHLAGVLDDATLVSGPESDSALLSAKLDGDRILIAGELHPGETVRVTYTVRVLGDAERGDSVLGNFVVKPGVTPPAVCEPGSTLCTENPVSPTPVKPVPPLEETGGASTLPWLLGGGAVILLGAALLLVRRKRGGDSAESPAGSAESTDGN
ncbi:hypothetical protein GCM10009692_31940 [Leucobacter aridicollis]